MAVEYRIISIGTLSHNRLWGEAGQVRTAHATITCVEDQDRLILVDPSLPGEILAARFHERTGKQLSAVTDVFCTTLRPVHRRGLPALEGAHWWCAEDELETYRSHLVDMLDKAERLSPDDAQQVEADLQLLDRFEACPEKLSPQVGLFPLAGPSVGSAGLLLTPAAKTIVIAGDAVATGEHLRAGQIWQGCFNAEQAMESFRDVLEIADVIIPGHDNVVFSPQRWL